MGKPRDFKVKKTLGEWSAQVGSPLLTCLAKALVWRHDIQHKDIQHKDTQHNGLNAVMLSVVAPLVLVFGCCGLSGKSNPSL
jgi:hypothetical protein